MSDFWWKFVWYAKAFFMGMLHPFASEQEVLAWAKREADRWMARIHGENWRDE